jgi:hypothetical protein
MTVLAIKYSISFICLTYNSLFPRISGRLQVQHNPVCYITRVPPAQRHPHPSLTHTPHTHSTGKPPRSVSLSASLQLQQATTCLDYLESSIWLHLCISGVSYFFECISSMLGVYAINLDHFPLIMYCRLAWQHVASYYQTYDWFELEHSCLRFGSTLRCVLLCRQVPSCGREYIRRHPCITHAVTLTTTD